MVHFIQNNCLHLSVVSDQRKLRQNVGLENINMMSNYDVTNNAHQIQMKPYATELTLPHKNFLRTPLGVANLLHTRRQFFQT